MKIKNTTYANTPIATKAGTFTPDASGVLDAPDDAAKMLCSLAGFVSLEPRTPRVLAPAPATPPSAPSASFPTPAPEVPAVLAPPAESPVEPRADTEPPTPPEPVVRPRGPKPKTR